MTRLGLDSMVSTYLYNVFEPLPTELLGAAEAFHTNPPYGQFNGGRSVEAFVERALAGVGPDSIGIIITANDRAYPWTRPVLGRIYEALVARGIAPYRVVEECHRYDLDDQPDLRSGVMWCEVPGDATGAFTYVDLPPAFRECFYGRETIPIPKYISFDGEAEQLLLPV
jgi:hypothetical protein